MSDAYFKPVVNPQLLSFRPLSGGMRRDKPPTLLDKREFYTVAGYINGVAGPLRSPAAVQQFGGQAVGYPPVYGYEVFFKTDGTQVTVVWDSKYLYTASQTSLTAHYWEYSVGTAEMSGALLVATATSSFTATANYLRAGDTFTVGAGASLETLGIAEITSSHVITATASPTLSHAAGSAYAVRRAFGAAEPNFVDTTVIDNKLVVADSTRPLYSYDGTDFTIYDASLTFIPSCLTYHADRLWVGRPTNAGTDYRHRIIWSTQIDHTDFGTFGTSQFVDRPYTAGALRRLVPLGPYLIAYFEDAIDFGRPSNIPGNTLPFSFDDRLQTGGIGISGMKAVRPWLDGHFFVGQDDIYYLGLQGGFERIGTAVVKETVEACDNPWAIWVMPDVVHSRIVFGFPETTTSMTKLWSFDYRAKAWSYEERGSVTALGYLQKSGISNDGLDAYASTIDGLDAVFPTIAGLGGSNYEKTFIFGTYTGYSYRIDPDTSEAVSTTLETADFDFNEPDKVKSFTRLSVRIDRVLASALAFTVQGSGNSGTSWRTLGTLTIAAGRDEGFINFQISSSTVRFRLTSSSDVTSYRVSEYGLKAKGRGLEAFMASGD